MLKQQALGLLLFFSLAGAAGAHDFWLKPEGNRAILFYGHGSEDSPYSASSLKKATGLAATGKSIPVRIATEGNHCALGWDGEAVEVAAEIDTGYWIKTARGWENKSKRNAGGYLLSEWSLFYTKLLVKPRACLGRALGHQLELVPVQVDEKSLKVRVLLHGKALADAKIYSGHDKVAETDGAGEATVAKSGLLVLAVSTKEPLKDNPDADRLKLSAVLSVP